MYILCMVLHCMRPAYLKKRKKLTFLFCCGHFTIRNTVHVHIHPKQNLQDTMVTQKHCCTVQAKCNSGKGKFSLMVIQKTPWLVRKKIQFWLGRKFTKVVQKNTIVPYVRIRIQFLLGRTSTKVAQKNSAVPLVSKYHIKGTTTLIRGEFPASRGQWDSRGQWANRSQWASRGQWASQGRWAG
jgi:hypothetical protein